MSLAEPAQRDAAQVGVEFAYFFEGVDVRNAVAAAVNPDFHEVAVQGVQVHPGPLPLPVHQEPAVYPYVLRLFIQGRQHKFPDRHSAYNATGGVGIFRGNG